MLKYIECPGLPRGILYSVDAGDRIGIRPLGLMSGPEGAEAVRNGLAYPIAGGSVVFTACEVFVERRNAVNHCMTSVSEFMGWMGQEGDSLAHAVEGEWGRLTGSRASFAGLPADRPAIFGIVNVTPDSFHDGGRYANIDAAIAHGNALIEAGADAIDIGGESTRPGSEETPESVELERVLPVVRALRGNGAVLSVDTRRSSVMKAARDAGADVINDVTALGSDPEAVRVAADLGVNIILMHMQGEPRTMQDKPRYGHAPYEVWRFLKDRVKACTDAGIPCERIAVDPGIGFGKTVAHNLQLLSSTAMLHGTGAHVMVGASRKSFIGRIFKDIPSEERLPGSLAAAMIAVSQAFNISESTM